MKWAALQAETMCLTYDGVIAIRFGAGKISETDAKGWAQALNYMDATLAKAARSQRAPDADPAGMSLAGNN